MPIFMQLGLRSKKPLESRIARRPNIGMFHTEFKPMGLTAWTFCAAGHTNVVAVEGLPWVGRLAASRVAGAIETSLNTLYQFANISRIKPIASANENP